MDKNFFKKIIVFGLILFNVYVWGIIGSYFLMKPAVHFLNVFQGDAILIGGKFGNILIDAGKKNYVLKPLSAKMAFFDKTIDVALVTHADTDHFEGFLSLLDYYKVKVVIANDFSADNEKYQKLLQKIIEKDIKVVYGVTGTKIYSDEFDMNIVYPSASQIDNKKTNENSIVALVSIFDKNFLMTGDINNKILNKIALDGLVKNIDFLKLAHHGAKNSVDSEFLEKFDIKDVAVSVGSNSYGHPNKTILEMLGSFGVNVLRTDQNGTISVFGDEKGYWISK